MSRHDSNTASAPSASQADATQPKDILWDVVATPDIVRFPATEVGAVSPPQRVQLINRGATPAEISNLDLVPYQAFGEPALPGEFEIVSGSHAQLAPSQGLVIDVVFRPRRVAPHVRARLVASGASRSEAVHVTFKAVGVKPRAENADQRELSTAEHEARKLRVSPTPRVERYGDMLAAVLAARELTDNAEPGDTELHAHLEPLLQPVARRLDELNDHQGRLSVFGAGNIAGQTALDTAQNAVQSWLRRAALGAGIDSEVLVTKFRIGAETIRFLTGERRDAPILRAFHDATQVTLAGAATAMLAAPLIPIVAEEALLLAFVGRLAAQRVALWALHNPVAALAASEALLGFGIQIGQDGWAAFWDQLRTPQGCMFVLMQVLMDYMQIRAGRSPAAGTNASPSDPAPSTSAHPPSIESVHQRVSHARALMQQLHDEVEISSLPIERFASDGAAKADAIPVKRDGSFGKPSNLHQQDGELIAQGDQAQKTVDRGAEHIEPVQRNVRGTEHSTEIARQATRSAAGNAESSTVTKYVFEPSEKANIQKKVRDAALESAAKAYESAIARGEAPAQANTAANIAAKDAAEIVARLEAERFATNTARAMASGEGIDSKKLDLAAQTQLAGFNSGALGKESKRLAKQLEGLNEKEFLTLMNGEPCAAKSVNIDGPPPQSMRVYEYADGTVVRYKPLGDRKRTAPTYSIEIKKDTYSPDLGKDDAAFKVDASGRAVPKNPFDVKNPFPKGGPQWLRFRDELMDAGHSTLQRDNNGG